jgi:hypothetical protein
MANPYHDGRGQFTTAGHDGSGNVNPVGSPRDVRTGSHVGPIRITVLPGKHFNGVHHFQATKYDASPNAAKHAVETGVAQYTYLRK